MEEIIINKALKLEITNIEKDILNIKLIGSLDSTNARDYHLKVYDIISKGNVKIVFDFAELSGLTLDGIADFTDFMKHLREFNGKMVLININSDVKKIFDLLGFIKFFLVAIDINEALNKLKAN